MIKKYVIPFVLTILCVVILLPFFDKGFFETDDGTWAVIRQASMHSELRQGQFPVRWSGSLNFGYGYPLFNFSYPGPYYLGEAFHLFGLSFLSSVKAVFVISTVVSVIAMYYFASELWRNKIAGLIAAIFFLAAPYRLINLYQRGSIGETLAIAFFPLLCLMGLRLLTTGKRRYIFGGAIFLALLLLSHNVLSFLFIPFFIYWMLVEIFLRYVKFSTLFTNYLDQFRDLKISYTPDPERKTFTKHIHLILVMVLLGTGLSAFFWLPAISEIKYTKLSQTPLTNIESEFSRRSWILSTPFERKVENVDKIKFFNRNTVYIFLVVIFAILCILLFYRKNYLLGSQRTILYILPLILALFMMSPFSTYLWKNIPGLNIIDFPWRFWGLVIFIFPIIIASVSLIPICRYIGLTLAIVALILSTSHNHKLIKFDQPTSYYETNQATTTSASEYLNKWTNVPYTNSPDAAIIAVEGNDSIDHQVITNKSIFKEYSITVSDQTEVSTSIMYFPGWQLKLDGIKHEFSYLNNGLISTQIPSGTHNLVLEFTNTPIRMLANSISVLTFLFITVFLFLENIKAKKVAI
jgi:hypothetical protein